MTDVNPPQASDAEEVAKVENDINSMYEESKKEQEAAKDNTIKEQMIKKYDDKLRSMGFATQIDIDNAKKAYEERIATLEKNQKELTEMLTRAKAQGKAVIPIEDKKDEKKELTEIYGDLANL